LEDGGGFPNKKKEELSGGDIGTGTGVPTAWCRIGKGGGREQIRDVKAKKCKGPDAPLQPHCGTHIKKQTERWKRETAEIERNRTKPSIKDARRDSAVEESSSSPANGEKKLKEP